MNLNAEHVLYRMFDESNALLYVGVTANFGQRMRRHQAEKPWWPFAVTIKLEHFETREAALNAERNAILHEKPACNVVHGQLSRQPSKFRNNEVVTLGQMNARVPAELRLQVTALARVRGERDDHGGGIGAVIRREIDDYVARYEHLLPADWQPPADDD